MAHVLNGHGVSYALIGGLGANVRGQVRATLDIDFLVEVPQVRLPAVFDALIADGFALDLHQSIEAWNRDHLLDFSYASVRIDWLKPVLPVFARILQRARWEQIGDRQVRVADAEGLLLLKLIAFRPRDEEDIKSILAANPGRLDLNWVRDEWRQLADKDDPKTSALEALIREFYEPGGGAPQA
jgi:predicted nucleotidyltransferase